MSKLSTITAAIELLEKAEDALLEAKRAFPRNGPEYDILATQADVVGNALHVAQHKILPRIESELISSAQIKKEI